MIYEGELEPYFTDGMIKITGRVYDILHHLPNEVLKQFPRQNYNLFIQENLEMERVLGDAFEESVVQKIIGKSGMDLIDDDPIVWNSSYEPHKVGAGFFVWANEIDWDAGTLKSDFIPAETHGDANISSGMRKSILVSKLFKNPDYSVCFSGMCFELDTVEMLLPNEHVAFKSTMAVTRGEQVRQMGRPRKWDWEAALAHIIALANKPDGLPTGAGAQARIEELLAQWFIDQTGECTLHKSN